MHCPTLGALPSPLPNKRGWPWNGETPKFSRALRAGIPWPKFTVVTPSLNQGQFLEETIRSVLLQGYPNLEYIVIDGGSSDESVEIIRKYEKWLAYWSSEPDRGQSHAINKGFRRATGEIVAWLNSDDVYERDALRLGVTSLINHAADMVYGDCFVINERGEHLRRLDPPAFSLPNLLLDSFIPQPATFFRRHVFELIGLLDEDFNYAMDYDLWLRIASHFVVCKEKGVWANYRICEGTKSCDQPAAFWPEIVVALERFYTQPKVSEALARSRPNVLAHANLRAAVEYYQVNQIREGRTHLYEAFKADPLLDTNPEQVLRVVATFASTLEPQASQEFVDKVFDNLPSDRLRLQSERSKVGRRALLLSFYRFAPRRGRAWIITNLFDLLRDWRWLVQRPIFGILLFLVGGDWVRKLADARHRLHQKPVTAVE